MEVEGIDSLSFGFKEPIGTHSLGFNARRPDLNDQVTLKPFQRSNERKKTYFKSLRDSENLQKKYTFQFSQPFRKHSLDVNNEKSTQI